MFPCFTNLYKRDCVFTNSEGFCDTGLRLPLLEFLPYSKNILVPQFCFVMGFARRIYARLVCMSNIIFTSTPFKILDTIIGFYSVLMIYLRPFLRISYKCLSNESMNILVLYFSFLTKIHHKISSTTLTGSSPSPMMTMAYVSQDSRRPLFWMTPHSPILCNRVFSLVSFNVFHRFQLLLATRFASRSPTVAAKLVISAV